MNILALDTCFGACSVAAGRMPHDGCTALAYEFELRQTGHAEALMPMVDRVMRKAQLTFSALDRIAVTTGPGSFTGMRIGIAAARALSLATGVPVAGVPTLEVMAAAARLALGHDETANVRILVAVDARKDQVYAQLFGPAGEVHGVARVMTPRDAARLIAEGRSIIAGSGGPAVLEAAIAMHASASAVLPDLQPDARCLAALAHNVMPDGRPVRPLYLRPPDAKPQDGKSIARVP